MRESSPFKIRRPVKYYPSVVTPRIRAQEGLFVACSELETPMDHVLRSDWAIECLRVPADQKPRLLYEDGLDNDSDDDA